MTQEVRHLLLASPLEAFAQAVADLGWVPAPATTEEGARAAWIPDDGGEVVWLEPAGAPAPVLRLTGTDLGQLEDDLVLLADVRGTADMVDALAGATDRASLMATLRVAGLLARGPFDRALGEALGHALTAGDSEMQAAVSEGLRWTEWRELAAPIARSLQRSPIAPEVGTRLLSIARRLSRPQ